MTLAERYSSVRERIAASASGDVELIVVTKNHPVDLVSELYELGHRQFGENRDQEAGPKAQALAEKELAKQLGNRELQITGFIELNLTDDPGRGGVAPGNLLELAEMVLAVPGIKLLGLMAVAGLDVDPRVDFEKTLQARQTLKTLAPDADRLSMGMSEDFEIAIEMGATHIRVGSAITGPRPNNT